MSKTTQATDHEILEVFESPESDARQIYTFETDEITALCPFNFGGPDFYELRVRYVPSVYCIESKSLKRYIESFRDREITAEELGAEMHETFIQVIDPDQLYIHLRQARRGGMEEIVEFGEQGLRPQNWDSI